jgi:hypothetical protein
MIFLASLFGVPFPENEQKKIVCGPAFGASLFKLWGLVFFIFGPALFGSCAETGNKKPVSGPTIWDLDF